MRLGFLLGAGVSLPAGLPSTEDLTEAVLNTSGYLQHSSKMFYRISDTSRPSTAQSIEQEQLRSFLFAIKTIADKYFQRIEAQQANTGRQANYEDLYFAASQMREHMLEEYENPALEPLVKRLRKTLRWDSDTLSYVADLSTEYIRDVVLIKLSETPGSLNHLNCLVEAACDPRFSGCDVFTLNHDVLIESVFVNKQIDFVDGFGVRDGDVSWWDPSTFERPSKSFLIKLHGSMKWERYKRGLAKVWSSDYNYVCTGDGTMLDSPQRIDSPILVGTFNKIRDYSRTPFFDLQFLFRRQISAISILLVSGYSFGDKGINAVLSNWLRESSDRLLVVLDTAGEAHFDRARGAIRKLWNDFRGVQFVVISKYLSDTEWSQLFDESLASHFDHAMKPKSLSTK